MNQATEAGTELIPANDKNGSEISALLTVIERAARDPQVDIDKLERLLKMQEHVIDRFTTHQAKMDFNQAMNRCQSAMRPISLDAQNPQTKSKYASYAQLDRYLRPIYTENGFSIMFDTGEATKPEESRTFAEIFHVGGHSKTIHIDLDISGKGARGGDVMTKTHASASGVSYAKRYLLGMGFNVATGDNIDGNESLPVISEDQAMDIETMVKDTKSNLDVFLRHIGHKTASTIPTIRDIPALQYTFAVGCLEKKRLQNEAAAATEKKKKQAEKEAK